MRSHPSGLTHVIQKKTKRVKFSLPNLKYRSGSILIRNEELELVDTTVFLGFTLDNNLQWGPYIGYGKESVRISEPGQARPALRMRGGLISRFPTLSLTDFNQDWLSFINMINS
ncbi:hypothetical protein EVAR_22492_1 [Eumeta japonica]|uniref:Uncharacterized protein n=1 Tax=Eumeta variegata TaxID=151549 RepID=A0A4C1VCV2_EUMVA|nr:hypothetical protein EVAR_22492_1 [Eumeta japonica]